MKPVLLGVDAVLLRVPNLAGGIEFYHAALGHEVIWRTDSMVGLGMGESDTELVLSLDTGPETDLLVSSVDQVVDSFIGAGGSVISEPQDIPVGRVAVVRDPFDNELVLVDLSKGRYVTDDASRVTGVHRDQARPARRRRSTASR